MVTELDGGGLQELHRLKSTEPPLYLTPSSELSKAARSASEYLFSSLIPFASKSPLNRLFTEGFDAEQIWQQIDLQSQPFLPSLRRQVRKLEKNPVEIKKLFNVENNGVKQEDSERIHPENEESAGVQSESDGFDDEDIGEGEDEEEKNGDHDDDGEMDDQGTEKVNGVEDRFLKLHELEEYLEKDEAREYGLQEKRNMKRKKSVVVDEDGEENEDRNQEEEDEDDEDELGLADLGDEEDENKIENARYGDFFGAKRNDNKKKYAQDDDSDLGIDDKPIIGSKDKKKNLSTHEKGQEHLRSEIEKMEKANLEPKTWTMRGEATALDRPRNSALEVDLDFEHNVRPAPVITEEVTASLEELIKKRVIEARFDDVQKPPTLINKPPKERKELDENKSKKGLAEVYEDEYSQKTGLVSAALTFSDEQKKEAKMLFKKLCLKLDALSHFHFTPKPVIEDMSIQVNVPALAMEEIAPLAVSDAAMLAPEEVYAGKGDIKEETELTKADRKRRRANKKRKFKARSAKQAAVKMQQNHSSENRDNDITDKDK